MKQLLFIILILGVLNNSLVVNYLMVDDGDAIELVDGDAEKDMEEKMEEKLEVENKILNNLDQDVLATSVNNNLRLIQIDEKKRASLYRDVLTPPPDTLS